MKSPLNKGVLTENFIDIRPVIRAIVHARAMELTLIAGRPPPHVAQIDYEQARRELTDEPVIDSREAMLESIPESERC